MNNRVKIFMEGVSKLGLSPKQVETIGKITKVCLEGVDGVSDDIVYDTEFDSMSDLEDDEPQEEHSEELSIDEMYNKLIDLGVSNETIDCVTNINGYNENTMRDILYATQGYHDFDQIPEY
jgi:hypothetical protein